MRFYRSSSFSHLASFYFTKISGMTRGRSMKGEEVSVGRSCGIRYTQRSKREKGVGGDERGAAKGGRRESVRRECGPPVACEPTRVPLVRYFGIKAKQPLLDVTHEAASVHPGVLDSNNAPARWGTEESRNELQSVTHATRGYHRRRLYKTRRTR